MTLEVCLDAHLVDWKGDDDHDIGDTSLATTSFGLCVPAGSEMCVV